MGLAGCDVVTDLSPGSDADPGSDGTGAGAPTLDAVDADGALVERVAADVARTASLLPRSRALASYVEEVRVMHAAHHEALTGQPGLSVVTTGPPVPRARAVRLVRAAERAHLEGLQRAAVDATSGALAVLLAQMAAAVAQRLALLPGEEAA